MNYYSHEFEVLQKKFLATKGTTDLLKLLINPSKDDLTGIQSMVRDISTKSQGELAYWCSKVLSDAETYALSKITEYKNLVFKYSDQKIADYDFGVNGEGLPWQESFED